jgi:hypothetical protein
MKNKTQLTRQFIMNIYHKGINNISCGIIESMTINRSIMFIRLIKGKFNKLNKSKQHGIKSSSKGKYVRIVTLKNS